MVSLAADSAGQWTADGFPAVKVTEYPFKVPGRLPGEIPSSCLVHVDPIDLLQHSIAISPVDVFVARAPFGHDLWRIRVEHGQIIGPERRSGTDDIAAEADARGSIAGAQMRIYHVLKVDPPMKKLIGLQILVFERIPSITVVVFLRKETGSP